MALLSVAASCFVMIIAQSAATSRVFALRHHERVDADSDILGLATANAAAAVSGTFVVNGSPTQTAMADSAGARSQIAQLVFAGVVLLVLLVMTGPLQYLPRCVLAGIVCASSFVPILSRDEIPHWHYRLALGYKPVRSNLVFGSDSHQDWRCHIIEKWMRGRRLGLPSMGLRSSSRRGRSPDLYCDLLPLLNAKRVELLDNPSGIEVHQGFGRHEGSRPAKNKPMRADRTPGMRRLLLNAFVTVAKFQENAQRPSCDAKGFPVAQCSGWLAARSPFLLQSSRSTTTSR